MSFKIGDQVILTQHYHFGFGCTYRTGTLGVIERNDGGVTESSYYWVNFPNLPLERGRPQGLWVSPGAMRKAELLEILGGGETTTESPPELKARDEAWLRSQVRAARKARRELRVRERERIRKRREKMAKKDQDVAAEMLRQKLDKGVYPLRQGEVAGRGEVRQGLHLRLERQNLRQRGADRSRQDRRGGVRASEEEDKEVSALIDRIHPRIKDNAKKWYDESEKRTAKDTLKLLSQLVVEGIDFTQVGALLLVFAQHPATNIAMLIKEARDSQKDPECEPYLQASKEILLPRQPFEVRLKLWEEDKRHYEKTNDIMGLNEEQREALMSNWEKRRPRPQSDSDESVEEEKRRERGHLHRYQSPLVFGVLGVHIGLFKSPIEGLEREKGKGTTEEDQAKAFESQVGRPLTEEERWRV